MPADGIALPLVKDFGTSRWQLLQRCYMSWPRAKKASSDVLFTMDQGADTRSPWQHYSAIQSGDWRLYIVPMSEVFFEILSPLPLNSHGDARKLFSIWAENAPNFLPDRSGLCEPLRDHFSLSSLEQAIRTWEFQFLLKRVSAPKLESGVLMQYGPHRRHSTWTIGLKRIKDFDATSFCKLLKAAALTLSADFGFIHSNTAGDISRGLRNGSVTFLDVHRGKKNLFVTTHTLKKYVPDIYWMTFFGARYVQLFSRESLISAAAYRIEELDNGGIVVQLTPELTDVAADEVAFERIRRDVRIHLDSNAIYDTDKGVDHHYQVPEFAWGPVLH